MPSAHIHRAAKIQPLPVSLPSSLGFVPTEFEPIASSTLLWHQQRGHWTHTRDRLPALTSQAWPHPSPQQLSLAAADTLLHLCSLGTQRALTPSVGSTQRLLSANYWESLSKLWCQGLWRFQFLSASNFLLSTHTENWVLAGAPEFEHTLSHTE